MESLGFSIFSSVSAAASILSLVLGLWKYRRTVQILNVVIVVTMTVLASYSFFRLQEVKAREQSIERRRSDARQEASSLLRGVPGNLNYFEPGQSRGVALAGLAFLEQHRDLYPETFKLAQATIRRDIETAQAQSGSPNERHLLQTAGSGMIYMLRGLAAGSPP